jgi:hypothetical protein
MAETELFRAPLTGATWRRTLVALLILPAGLAGLALLLAGRPGSAAALQWRLAALLPEPRRARPRGTPAGRVPAHALAGVAFGLATLGVAVYGWLLVVLNVGYPVRMLIWPDADYAGSWGGPSFAGVWLLHGLAGLVFLFVVPFALRGLTRMWLRITTALLGP